MMSGKKFLWLRQSSSPSPSAWISYARLQTTNARLPSGERAELEDYKSSGYSRGHMAPAGDMPTPSAMVQSFSLANVVPQNAQRNGAAWAKIEQDTRHYVRRARGDVFVITGPVFAEDAPQIGANRVRVPAYLYKLERRTMLASVRWRLRTGACGYRHAMPRHSSR